ncbi:MAG: 5-methylthioadenosine/S-adenosylhomocysteine deaminase, partial [Mycobacteriales bacterium]
MSERLLVRGGHVVSMDPVVGDRPGCDVLIEDGVIVRIEPGLAVADAAVIDARGTLVLPGFVDTHRHTWTTVLRGAQPDLTLAGYMAVMHGALTAHYRPQDIYAGALLGGWEALNAGITTMLDYAHVNPTVEHAEAGIQALRETGIRALYAHGSASGVRREPGASEQPGHLSDLRVRHFPSDGGLLRLGLAFGNPYSGVDWELADALSLPATVHACARSGGAWPAAHTISDLAASGPLRPGTVYSHCTIATDQELRLVADSGGHVSASPYIEMVMGHGRPIIARAFAQGLRPTLGADVVSSGPGDMFSQLRAAYLLSRGEQTPADPDAPYQPTVRARDVLGFGTIDGATACGLGAVAGSLAPGKQADLVLLRVDQINTIPLIDPVGTVVAAADVSNVDTVLVGGVVRKRGG